MLKYAFLAMIATITAMPDFAAAQTKKGATAAQLSPRKGTPLSLFVRD